MLDTDDERYSLLVRILRDGRLGRGDADHPNGTGFTFVVHGDQDPLDNHMYSLPMVCFCDIPPDDLHIHMSKYSRFGIAFRKSFLIAKGARPVFYIPISGTEDGSYSQTFRCLKEINNVSAELVLTTGPQPGTPAPCTEHIRTLVSQLAFALSRATLDVFSYMKFFDVRTADDDPENYYMEREWRIPGTVGFTLLDVARIVLPISFATDFPRDLPEYAGDVTRI